MQKLTFRKKSIKTSTAIIQRLIQNREHTFLHDLFSVSRVPGIALGLCLGLSFSSAQAAISFPEQADIFAAAGFKNVNGAWRGKCSFGHIPFVQDLNGDGRPDAIIRDGGTECYGSTGVGFHLITKQATGKWTRILNSPGEPRFLKTVGRHGWPDIEIRTQSQCHTIYRWDGKKFTKNRQEFKGKPCLVKAL